MPSGPPPRNCPTWSEWRPNGAEKTGLHERLRFLLWYSGSAIPPIELSDTSVPLWTTPWPNPTEPMEGTKCWHGGPKQKGKSGNGIPPAAAMIKLSAITVLLLLLLLQWPHVTPQEEPAQTTRAKLRKNSNGLAINWISLNNGLTVWRPSPNSRIPTVACVLNIVLCWKISG